jgi:hypothetical protein
VDLYAGIGYYVVPFLVHHKVKHVHACEWNEVIHTYIDMLPYLGFCPFSLSFFFFCLIFFF